MKALLLLLLLLLLPRCTRGLYASVTRDEHDGRPHSELNTE
jgi:hypothetical protein